jgi:2-oxoglutarate ferredoxin oxidoreductase subunit beta
MIDFEKYLRSDKLPLIWCEGCGNGIILKAMLGAIDRLGLDQDEVTMVSGIGCSSRATGYVDFNTLHTTHGRAIAFATGVKMANPDLTVIVVTGDGDATAIGGNHFIHAARRNIDLTVVLFNNWIYGMTGGQVSPTTPHAKRATTAPYGNPEGSFDISNLAIAAGASFVARASVTNPIMMSRYIEKGIQKKGFSLIEAFTPCPTAFGRQNKLGKAIDNMTWIKESTIDVKRAAKMSPEDLEGKLITGILTDVEKAEYTSLYQQQVDRLRSEDAADGFPRIEAVEPSAILSGASTI